MSQETPSPVLVLSADALAAALLGALLETEGFLPLFPAAGEPPRDALRRHRPWAALVDGDYEEACSAAFVGPARMTGAAVVLFAPRSRLAAIREIADRHGLRMVEVPVTGAELARTLRTAIGEARSA